MLSRDFLIERGYCCGHGCLMCPYIPKHLKGKYQDYTCAKKEWGDYKFTTIKEYLQV